MVAHLVWDQGVAGSNPVIPTKNKKMKVYKSEIVSQFYVLPSIKVTHSRWLNGDYELIFGWFNQLIIIGF